MSNTPLTRFSQMARDRPDAPVIDTGDQIVTYRELDARSNAVAHLVRARGADPSAPVAIHAPRAIDFVVSILATLKAGYFYIPIDPVLPPERKAQIVRNGGVRLLLAGQGTVSEEFPVESVDLRSAPEAAGGIAIETQPLAFVIYTSGSTGEPKGIVRTRANLLTGREWNARRLEISPGSRAAWISAPGTAMASSEVFDVVMTGATLCPIAIPGRSLLEIAADLRSSRAEILKIVPSMFRHLASVAGDELRQSSLRMVRISGEPGFRHDLELFQRTFPPTARLQVALASSEGGQIMAVNLEKPFEGDILPVGTVGDDPEIRVVLESGDEAGPGEVGELQICGARLSPGLWKNGAIEPLPLQGAFLATGDLLRRGHDGLYYFAGRRDSMIKVRGHRVDLAAVEARILGQEGITETAVLGGVDAHGDTRVHAFIVAPEDVSLETLRARLAIALPGFMIPSRFERVPSLPRLASGKTDRIALTALARNAAAKVSAPEEPHHDLPDAGLLRRIWAETLGVTEVHDDDDFFELGGDSLLAAHFAARIEKELGKRLLLATLLEKWTFSAVADALEVAPREGYDLLVALNAHGSRPPLFCMTGEGGNVIRFRALARELGDDQPLFALQSHGLDGSTDIPETIEAIAADFVASVRRQQPRGPYLLAGYSMGGTLAWEMAQQLVSAGDEVALLALIDAPGNVTAPPWTSRLGYIASRLRAERIAALRPMIRDAVPAPVHAFFYALRVRAGIAPRTAVPRALPGVLETNRRAFASYRRTPYRGGAVLIRAEWGARRAAREQDLGWSALAEGGLLVVDVPGDHDQVMRQPVVGRVAAVIREQIDRIEQAVR